MAITKTSQQVTINKSYIEKVEERTRNISVEVKAGEAPRITIIRETVTYHDDVKVSTGNIKRVAITLSDLEAVGKVGLMKEIADTLDAIMLLKN